MAAGTTVKLIVQRAGQQQTVEVALGAASHP
jgi:hypothetical protein